MMEKSEYKRLVQKYIGVKEPELLSEDNFQFTKALISELEKTIKKIKKHTFGFNEMVEIRNIYKQMKAVIDRDISARKS